MIPVVVLAQVGPSDFGVEEEFLRVFNDEGFFGVVLGLVVLGGVFLVVNVHVGPVRRMRKLVHGERSDSQHLVVSEVVLDHFEALWKREREKEELFPVDEEGALGDASGKQLLFALVELD